MSLPPRTKMWLTMSCATELPKLKEDNIPKEMKERLQAVEEELKRKKEEERELIAKACREMHPARTALNKLREKKEELQKKIEKLEKETDVPQRLKKAEERLREEEATEQQWFTDQSREVSDRNERIVTNEMHEEFRKIRERKVEWKKKVDELREGDDKSRRLKKAKKELKDLEREEGNLKDKALEEMNSSRSSICDDTHEKLENIRVKKKELEDEIDALPKKDDAPNPFVVIAIDDEDDKETKPMLYTKAVRDTTNPIWKEKFEDFPLEMYLTGKTCYEVFHNGDDNYRPQKLTFNIYHDNGVKEQGKQKPKKSDDSWTRDNPQREILIGKADWDWFDVCRKVGCAEFEKEFPIMHPQTHKKIKDALLTIKVRLCAPKVRSCSQSCNMKDITQFMVGEEADEVVEVEKTQPLLAIRQKKKKSRTSSHGDDCLCSRCENRAVRRAPPRPRKI